MSDLCCLNISPDEIMDVILQSEIKEVFDETKSQLLLETDEVSAQIKLIHKGRPWLRYKLRDRRFDGPGWKPSPLTDWTYGGADDKFTLGGRAVEESVYCLDPRYPLTDRFPPFEAAFITNPFEHLPFDDPQHSHLAKWVDNWLSVRMKEKLVAFPGFFLLTHIPGVRKFIHNQVIALLKQKGYDYLTAVPTWWHTARICEHLGFIFQNERDRAIMDKLNARLPSGTPRDRCNSSWVVMLQFWAELAEKNGIRPESFLPDKDLIIRDESGRIITFPLSPEKNLWMTFKL
ncbi:MAG: hypothetical protein AAB606_02930 [Patescibacteria group bacterium]